MRSPSTKRPYTVILAGGIGSGKSTAGRILEELGCARIDLDQLSREVLEHGSPIIADICRAFGDDLVDKETGLLNRRLLATRAFATQEDAALLEAIELPAIRALLAQRLDELAEAPDGPVCCVVEVPLLDRMGEGLSLADEVMVVWCPLALRRERAIGRGMTGEDFDARAANQPTDKWLREHATTLVDNIAGQAELRAKLEAWYVRHEKEGWR